MQPATTPEPENSNNPYGYEVVSMDSGDTAGQQQQSPLLLSPPPRKRRRYQRRNSKTPAMLRFASSAPLLVRLDALEDAKDEVEELLRNTNFFASSCCASVNDASCSSDLSSSWSSLALETADELVGGLTPSHNHHHHQQQQQQKPLLKRKSCLEDHHIM